MRFTNRFLDEIRDRVPVSDIVGRKVKLTRRGHECTGLCPFHNEKTPSFHVSDEKRFYHCFGCGAHGDVIRFLTDAEKMPFPEAVEYLARLAGLPLPKSNPDEIHRDNARREQTDMMEEACRFYQQQLFGPAGANARAYFQRRGISADIARQFRLGYAPFGSALLAHFSEQGRNIKQAVQLGLIAENSARQSRHDYFYDRVMFPILDRRKRVIGFGGRIMGKGEPKYLNSPETDLFHKGEQLYALPNAIDTMRKTNQAILVEGYMDVIALHSAGFTNAVAPLGTALTENQIKLLWQACDEPIICFDGDGAGRRASIRALKRALPILTAGKSLQFVFLPDPFDPDDMIRKKSPEAFRAAINSAKPLSYALWNMLLEDRSLDTPERRAKLEADALDTVAQIQDERTRNYYTRDIKNRLWKLGKSGGKKNMAFTDAHRIVQPTQGLSDAKMLLAYLICYPTESQSYLEDISLMKLPENALQGLLELILQQLIDAPETDSNTLQSIITSEALAPVIGEIEMLRKSNRTDEDVRLELKRRIQTIHLKDLEQEKQEKIKSYAENPTPETWEQITQLKIEIEKLTESE